MKIVTVDEFKEYKSKHKKKIIKYLIRMINSKLKYSNTYFNLDSPKNYYSKHGYELWIKSINEVIRIYAKKGFKLEYDRSLNSISISIDDDRFYE